MMLPFWSCEDSVAWNLKTIPTRIIKGDYWYWWKRGFRNWLRYARVVWSDEDFDWTGLVEIMAFKFEQMAEVHKNGHLLHREKYERQLRIAAHCCRRMLADEYFEQAGYDPEKWPGDAAMIGQRAGWARSSDQRILGKLIGRHICCWWD